MQVTKRNCTLSWGAPSQIVFCLLPVDQLRAAVFLLTRLRHVSRPQILTLSPNILFSRGTQLSAFHRFITSYANKGNLLDEKSSANFGCCSEIVGKEFRDGVDLEGFCDVVVVLESCRQMTHLSKSEFATNKRKTYLLICSRSRRREIKISWRQTEEEIYPKT